MKFHCACSKITKNTASNYIARAAHYITVVVHLLFQECKSCSKIVFNQVQ